jgi:hypothetical protein
LDIENEGKPKVKRKTKKVLAAEKAEREAAGIPEPPEPPTKCGFVLPRTVCKREVTRDEALYYIKTGKTEVLEDFTSRFGRPFSAMLFLKETGKHGFEFPPRKPRAGADGETATKKKTTKKKAAKKKTTKKKATKKKATKKKTAKKAAPKKTAAKKTTKKKATKKKATKKKTAKKTAAKSA